MSPTASHDRVATRLAVEYVYEVATLAIYPIDPTVSRRDGPAISPIGVVAVASFSLKI